jgi:hypothetical protein
VQWATGLHHGNHVIQSFLYATNGATIENFEITYRLYRPI